LFASLPHGFPESGLLRLAFNVLANRLSLCLALLEIVFRFSLMVDPGRTYQLIADPLAGATVARAMLGKVTSGTGDTTMPARTLPTGHLVSGTVTAAAVGPIAGARLQVFCPAWSSQCPNPDFALDTVVTDTAGRFQLRLPEPPAP